MPLRQRDPPKASCLIHTGHLIVNYSPFARIIISDAADNKILVKINCRKKSALWCSVCTIEAGASRKIHLNEDMGRAVLVSTRRWATLRRLSSASRWTRSRPARSGQGPCPAPCPPSAPPSWRPRRGSGPAACRPGSASGGARRRPPPARPS